MDNILVPLTLYMLSPFAFLFSLFFLSPVRLFAVNVTWDAE